MVERPPFERYTFVMVTTQDLVAARKFWVEQLGFPATGLKVRSVVMVLSPLAERGITEEVEPLSAKTGVYAIIHDPDGRPVVLTEAGVTPPSRCPREPVAARGHYLDHRPQ